ncbi:MFS transporter [Glaciimonas sp. CA11.2]|uniref:MFS transporter n=1 Tax=unclassified Glaciimonas TaxID=2644401 RepID=UPI002AB5AB74|nr:MULTISPECIES: MFS transporter [unclassified Glaciimonas]MDY7548326.1 MFS transporter [Glaciimonas sp. CA11.2]MEB0010524.1 MFS transporter [Glaciimonas sp. Cout2]MEB0083526.1 MFS transporter [Glaciimonas sp. Gout2]MEB0162347.1 MFS transporter [Glaciimonas sp. CA11.2]
MLNAHTDALPRFEVASDTEQPTARLLFAGCVGNALEWFDWLVYTGFAIFFTKQFFPTNNETTSLLSTFAVFAVGFSMRPIGGWLTGAFADRYGRRTALAWTIGLMGGSSLLIAILPTFHQIGIAAPIALTILRMLQGLSAGGEYGASAAYMAESAPPAKRGFYASFMYVGVASGLLLASILTWAMTYFVGTPTLEAWAWRIPFFIGGCASIFGGWLRYGIRETDTFIALRARGIKRRSLLWIWRNHRREVLRVIGIAALGAPSFYLFVSYIPVYAIRHAGAVPSVAFGAATAGIAVFLISQPFFGMLSDRIGRRPPLIAFALLNVLFLYPVVMSTGASFTSVFLVECFGLLSYGLYSAIAPTVMAEVFSAEIRVTSIGTVYNLVVALIGGTTPYLMTYFASRHQEGWFITYVIFWAFISLITYIIMPETRGISLDPGK